jgi:deoxyribodipyrimidine photo-lyase
MVKQPVCVFIFRRDFRLQDNTTLLEAAKAAAILPIFIFYEQQISPENNPYFSNNQVQFMIQCITDLQSQIAKLGGNLYIFETKTTDIDILDKLTTLVDIKAIAFNKDITPFALQRDSKINEWCRDKGIEAISREDYTMLPIDRVKNKSGKPYEVYTPFYRTAVKLQVQSPLTVPPSIRFENKIKLADSVNMNKYFLDNPNVEIVGGRREAMAVLQRIRSGSFRLYEKQRDFPSHDSTTRLSAYIKFGCVSIREVYDISKIAMGKNSLLVQQLLWREYYYNIAYHFPEVLRGQIGKLPNTFIRGKYEKAQSKWNESEEDFLMWARGETGFPIVDAAMRCLNTTGWMHNRLRMVVAMFLVRHLNIDWRKGEQYFATQLVDYDTINNNQGWCWCLTYRRTLNPFKQTGKYDPQCVFIKKWVPELRDVPVVDIIVWWEKSSEYLDRVNYPKMMIELPGYRVKYKTYIAGYVRPKLLKDPSVKRKQSKYSLGQKNTGKYDSKNNVKGTIKS